VSDTNITTEQFLNALYGNLDEGHVYLWTLPDHRTWPFAVDELRTMASAAHAIQDDKDVYFGLGGALQEIRDNKRLLANNVSFITCLWMDIDIATQGAHAHDQLPKTIEEALGILPDFLGPSIVVWSGNGLHVYWLLKEAWIFDSQEENLRASNLMIRLQAFVRSLAQERGWKLDSTPDLSRVLRVPGTLNHKMGQSKPVVITQFDESVRYDPSELEDLIPDIDFRAEITNHGKFERRPTDVSSDLMIGNCAFLQYCLINASSITYGEWLSMLTNVVRGTDGIDKCHELSRPDTGRYTPKGTDFRISEALNMNGPQTCEYIRTSHGFPCPAGGCGVKSPSSFSLGRVDQARARINMLGIPTTEKVFQPEILTALSIVKRSDPALYARVKDKLKGSGINLNDLNASIKHLAQETIMEALDAPSSSGTVVDIPCGELSGIPKDYIFPPAFRINNDGISYVKTTNEGPILLRACGCPVYIKARLYNEDTDSESLKIAYRHMGHWRDLVVPRSVAINSRLVINLADRGLAVASDSARYAAKYFDDCLCCNPDIPVQKAVSHFGWRGKAFIFPGLCPDIEIDVDDIESKHALKGFLSMGILNDWVNVANDVRNTSSNARFMLSAGFSSPLLKLLSQRNFIIHNHGGSGGGKTAALWLAISIWADPDPVIASFNNSPTSLERRASLFSDLPFGINEREVLGQQQKQDISPIIYMLAEGKGKGRGSKSGLQKLNTWRTVVLATGEGPLTSAASMDGFMNRLIEIDGGPLADNVPLARYLYEFLPNCHGQAGIVFLQHLMEAQLSDIVELYREAQARLKYNFPDRLDSHLDALACVTVADYLSGVWVFNKEPTIAKSESYHMIAEIASKLIRQCEASESERAWLAFMDWVGENSDKLSNSYSSRIGTKDGVNIYLIRSVVDKFLSQYSSAQKIIKDWAGQGKIRTWRDGEKNRFDYKRSIGGARVRCIVFAEDLENTDSGGACGQQWGSSGAGSGAGKY